MFRIFLGWAICGQAYVSSDGNESWKPANSESRLAVGDHSENDKLDLMGKLEVLDKLDVVDKLEKLEVVVLDQPLKPVLHGTIIRITSKDKLCNLRMSTNKYPVK